MRDNQFIICFLAPFPSSPGAPALRNLKQNPNKQDKNQKCFLSPAYTKILDKNNKVSFVPPLKYNECLGADGVGC